MKEILYKYSTRGLYYTEDGAFFDGEDSAKITAEPHEFSIGIGEEVLRSTSFEGCTVFVTAKGGAEFYDAKGNLLGRAEEGAEEYKGVLFGWTPEELSLNFGQVEEVDYYPNCDGEFDRWGHEWVSYRSVFLNLSDRSVSIK